MTYTVKAGEREIVALKRGGYFPVFLEPGETEFSARTEARASVTENLKAGEIYFLKGEIGVGILMGRPKLSFVDRSWGETEILDCKLLSGTGHVAAAQ